MIEVKQPGKSTYVRNMITWIFEPDRIEKDLYRFVKEFGKAYAPQMTLGNLHVKIIDTWTRYGPHGEAKLMIVPGLYLKVGCYRDGWHIKLDDSENIQFNMRKVIFGDPNKNHVFTKETEKVVDIIGEIYQAVKEYQK